MGLGGQYGRSHGEAGREHRHDDCDTDLSFPAVMQEYTFLMMDTTDNPSAVPVPGTSAS